MNTMDGHWTMKLGLGVHQVIWYLEKSIVRDVKHVLKYNSEWNALFCSLLCPLKISFFGSKGMFKKHFILISFFYHCIYLYGTKIYQKNIFWKISPVFLQTFLRFWFAHQCFTIVAISNTIFGILLFFLLQFELYKKKYNVPGTPSNRRHT